MNPIVFIAISWPVQHCPLSTMAQGSGESVPSGQKRGEDCSSLFSTVSYVVKPGHRVSIMTINNNG